MALRMAPSILAADMSRLAEAANRVAGAADMIHVDVMDSHFVPNLTVGLPVVESLARSAELPLDIHLGVADPDHWAIRYAEAGAASVTIHAEAVKAPVRTLRAIRGAGAQAGLALNPATPLEPYEALLREVDMLLVMTVEPGFGNQEFLGYLLAKVSRARRVIDEQGLPLWLQVDGGVNLRTIESCAAAGADAFVAGSAVYGAEDPGAAVAALRRTAEEARGLAAANFGQPTNREGDHNGTG
ncbi:ribulose-phosphate 3-epimerase [Nonomuraea sp. NPDC050547]|uniref:ribulose-phosphate 3-epimerase n=1 Tax=Nonomuraea sp. NPDC050547 TaxID=3364368 RepID=UPI0037A6D40E